MTRFIMKEEPNQIEKKGNISKDLLTHPGNNERGKANETFSKITFEPC